MEVFPWRRLKNWLKVMPEAMLLRTLSEVSPWFLASMASGDMEQAKKALSAFLSDPKAQALLRQLEEEKHG